MATSTLAPAFSFPGAALDTAPGSVLSLESTDNNSRPVVDTTRPSMVRNVSSPSQELQSPLRHHRRAVSLGRPPIRETLNACLTYDDEDGVQGVRINQYTIKKEIGRGSFGAVHLAQDQDGQQYAMKEFSKSRLRRRSQSHILRRPHAARRRGGAFLNMPSHSQFAFDIHNQEEAGNPLYLIREEIAILKKLDHENVARLVEVLDDPEGDSLYIVLEMCEKGVIMKVGLDEVAEPYSEEKCRLWFRDMILGIEYLHSQGVVHRDIKPDNLLLSKDDVLKIVDFGVSEMFEKKSPMMTAKSAGSPAFLPPELCYAGHGDISGTAADIWSMGVTLYCLLFGRLPFSHSGVIELYEAIKHDSVPIPDNLNPDLIDLLQQLFAKDPNKRIEMPDLRAHPWVTRDGEDMLLPTEENTTDFIPAPTEEEMASAITKSIRNVMAVVKAVQKLKRLTLKRLKSPLRPSQDSNTPNNGKSHNQSQSLNPDDRTHSGQNLAVVGYDGISYMETENLRQIDLSSESVISGTLQDKAKQQDDGGYVSAEASSCVDSPMKDSTVIETLQADSTMHEELPFLQIGAGSDNTTTEVSDVVSESPSLTSENVYEEAYRQDVNRIRKEQGQSAAVSLSG